ncbi:MAG: ABC transporter permease [Kofleriaceae bacterium]
MTATVLTGVEATAALARLTIKRALRGKAIWAAAVLALVPLLMPLLSKDSPAKVWSWLVGTYTVVLTIAAPILVASSMSDEIDDRTAAYLWSRPLARWTIIAGKIVGLTPVIALTVAVGLTLSWVILGAGAAVSVATLARGIGAFTAGAVGFATVSATIATLAPRFAVPIAVCWLLLFDATVGALDFGLHVVTVSFGTRALANGTDLVSGPVSLAVLTAIAAALAVWRIDRIE